MDGWLTPHPRKAIAQSLRLLRTDIICPAPRSRAGPPQVERTLGADRVLTIATGPDLLITEPEKVAEHLLLLPAR